MFVKGFFSVIWEIGGSRVSLRDGHDRDGPLLVGGQGSGAFQA
jgi:hypothetical protein